MKKLLYFTMLVFVFSGSKSFAQFNPFKIGGIELGLRTAPLMPLGDMKKLVSTGNGLEICVRTGPRENKFNPVAGLGYYSFSSRTGKEKGYIVYSDGYWGTQSKESIEFYYTELTSYQYLMGFMGVEYTYDKEANFSPFLGLLLNFANVSYSITESDENGQNSYEMPGSGMTIMGIEPKLGGYYKLGERISASFGFSYLYYFLESVQQTTYNMGAAPPTKSSTSSVSAKSFVRPFFGLHIFLGSL